MAAIHSFRDLRVYQVAREAAQKIFEISKRFPPDEKYSLRDQIRRASRGVGSNIAEAWRKRRYPAAFVSKLSDADAEAAEVQSWLDSASDCNYINQDEFESLNDRYDHINSQLRLMMDQPEKWCSASDKNTRKTPK